MTNKVEEQYRNWVYPLPIEDMRSGMESGEVAEIGDPHFYWPIIWPYKRGVDEPLDILCAGCGSNQAAYYACRNPKWNVIGVDLSESSLAHQQMLKEKHNLTNLQLYKLDLTEIQTLGLDFDFITCTGVLHHMPDPDVGLKALKSVLRPEGVINLMVYGKSLRLGVYLLQEAFRMMGLEQTQEDVELVKSVIASLPPEHVVKRYVKIASDLHYDAAYVDTFLHPQDQAYWIKDVFAFTRRAGLEFLSWCDPVDYSLDDQIPLSHPLRSKIGSLSAEDSAHVSDLLVQAMGVHRWFAAHPTYVSSVKIPFGTDALLDCKISLNRQAKVTQQNDLNKKINARCTRLATSFEVDYRLADVMARAAGKKNIRQAIEEMRLPSNEEASLVHFLNVEIERLYNMGHIYVILPERV